MRLLILVNQLLIQKYTTRHPCTRALLPFFNCSDFTPPFVFLSIPTWEYPVLTIVKPRVKIGDQYIPK